MQNGESAKLPDLPKSSDKFWDKAKKYQATLIKKPKCQHYFEYGVGREIVCKNCNIGYYLSGNERVIDGKLVF